MFISLEGIDGCGKSTQLDRLEQLFLSRGQSVVRVRDPGGTEVAEEIRQVLLQPRLASRVDSMTELLLYNAARAQLLAEAIRPALADGKVVLSDRFAWSTYAYQGFGRGIDPEKIATLTEIACSGTLPDLTVVLDIPVELSLARRAERNRSMGENDDRLESEKSPFFERVRQGYLAAAERYPQRVVVINGVGTVDEVAARVAEQFSLASS